MKRGRKPQEVLPDPDEPIGHISTPIEDSDLEQVQTILSRHGVNLYKMNTPDNWWLLLLPHGTMKVRVRTPGMVATSTVRLPNGFYFHFEEAIFDRDKAYVRFPRISLEGGRQMYRG